MKIEYVLAVAIVSVALWGWKPLARSWNRRKLRKITDEMLQQAFSLIGKGRKGLAKKPDQYVLERVERLESELLILSSRLDESPNDVETSTRISERIGAIWGELLALLEDVVEEE